MTLLARCILVAGLLIPDAAAHAQSSASLNKVVGSGICPRDLSKYKLLSFRDRCENPNDGRHRGFDENVAIGRCQDQVTRDNDAIVKYNKFMDRCDSMKSGASGSRGATNDPRPSRGSAPPERTFSSAETQAAENRCANESLSAAPNSDPHHKRKWDQAELDCYRRLGMGGIPEARRIARNLGDGTTDAYDRRMDAIGRSAGSGGGSGASEAADFGNSVADAIRARNGSGSGCRYNVGSNAHPRYTRC